MATDHRTKLSAIKRFDQLIAYLRDEMGWPISRDAFEVVDDLFYDFTPEELGIDQRTAAKIQEIRRLRPLSTRQPWGIFFVKFEPKQLPVVALRRILGQVALKNRASANKADRRAWAANDLLFVSNFGSGEERQISFAHFSQSESKRDLPTLRVLGWNNLDTALHLDAVATELTSHLAWPSNESDVDEWRRKWSSAFTIEHREVVTTSRGLSIRMAALARNIRDTIVSALSIETDAGPLTQLMKGFQASLVHDLDADGFADMYAQTIAYGLLSSRIAHPQSKTVDDFAGHMRTNPFLRELMETFMVVGGRQSKAGGAGIDFDELGISGVVALLDTANMEAVVRDFGDRNPLEDPVIHFYELFLKEYDATKRMQRGVFYTPRSIVSYIVRSVDEMLRSQFGLADGLADTASWGEMKGRLEGLTIPHGTLPTQAFVQILDPATGTGTFLVEVIDIIHKTLVDKWERQGRSASDILDLWNAYVPEYLLSRLHGFELLMAPYAIAHLKIGLKLFETGYRFQSDARSRVYLTNALEPAHDISGTFKFAIPALANETKAVNEIKTNQHFTVVLGNPPYAGVSSNMSEHAQRLVAAYRVVDGVPLNERKIWLQDDYVKFMRYSQMEISRTGVGVLALITNHGYLDNPTFRGMRRSLMDSFDSLRVLDLHGNALKRERSPDGTDDKNVFEIRQGVAVIVATRVPGLKTRLRADLWGATEAKHAWLGAHTLETTHWTPVEPVTPFYFFHGSTDADLAYEKWTPLSDLMPTYSSGIITARDDLVMDFTAEPILERIGLLRDSKKTDKELRELLFEGKSSPKYAPGDSRGWKLPEARKTLQNDSKWRDRIVPCMYRPFDLRQVYLTEWMVDWSRPELRKHLQLSRNPLLVFPRNTGSGKPWDHVFVSYQPILGRFFPDSACITYMAPLFTIAEQLFGSGEEVVVNIHGLRDVPSTSTVRTEAEIRKQAESELGYVYAILHSPAYRARYASRLRADFPRIPNAPSVDLWHSLSALGSELVTLHLDGPRTKSVASCFFGKASSRVAAVAWLGDTVWLDASGAARGKLDRPGTVGFMGVSAEVWHFQIGGYQVCEKWLKDRKGLILSTSDILTFERILAVLAETVRLMNEIDATIDVHGGWPDAFVK